MQRDALRVLVTGSRGFVGKRVVTQLASLGYQPVEFRGDVTLPESFVGIPGQCSDEVDVVVHCAANITHKGDVTAGEYSRVNIEGTRNLLTYYGRCHFVLVSTTDVTRNELSEYASSKLVAEELVRAHHSYCIVRLVSVFGPDQKQRSKLIPRLLDRYFLGGPSFEIREDMRSYVFLDDAANAIACAVKQKGQLDILGTKIGNLALERLVLALASGSPIEAVDEDHRKLFLGLKICAEHLVIPKGEKQ